MGGAMFQEIGFETLELNPFTAIGEDSFLITAGDSGDWNTMTAAGGSMGFQWNRPVFSILVRNSRHTYGFLEKAEGFTCSFFSPEWKEVLQFCGSHSGRDTDKARETGLKPICVEGPDFVERMTFEQANLVFSCTIASRIPFDPAQFVLPQIDDQYPKKDYPLHVRGFHRPSLHSRVINQENRHAI